MMNTKHIMKSLLQKLSLDALILTDGYNIHHLTGYRGHTGMMVAYEDTCMVLTDSRYTEQVELEAPQVLCVDIGKAGYSKTVADILEKHMNQQDAGKKQGAKIRIGFENKQISYMQYKALEDAFLQMCTKAGRGYELVLVPLESEIDKLREKKTPEEIEKLTRAERIGDQAFAKIIAYIRVHVKDGLTERQVALQLEYEMRSLGAEGISFDTIVASGNNSSMPHAMPSNRYLQDGDFVTMDFGCTYEGYCSDMTRTIHIGQTVDHEMQKVYDTVLKAQLAALDMVRPGVVCSEVDKCARDIISDAGYGAYFGHGLGHSVGLYIHEEPRFSMKCDAVLEPGVVITVEPGIYLPGRFGVRIEDMIVVTEDGYRNLATSPKELICIEKN